MVGIIIFSTAVFTFPLMLIFSTSGGGNLFYASFNARKREKLRDIMYFYVILLTKVTFIG